MPLSIVKTFSGVYEGIIKQLVPGMSTYVLRLASADGHKYIQHQRAL